MESIIEQILWFLRGALLVFYIIMISKVLLSYVREHIPNQVMGFLDKVTEPYIGLFSKLNLFPSLGRIVPVLLSFVVIHILMMLTDEAIRMLNSFHVITIGIVLSIIIGVVWSTVAFLLTLFVILLIIRFVSFTVAKNPYSGFLTNIDSFITPVTSMAAKLVGIFSRQQAGNYQTLLLTGSGTLFSIIILGGIGISLLRQFLMQNL